MEGRGDTILGQGIEHARKEHNQNESERPVVTQDEQLAGAIDLPQSKGVLPLESTARKMIINNK
jgi:hypothetical protein